MPVALPALKNFGFYTVVTALSAIFLQIQITLFANENYTGIRISSADLFLPFIGLFILYSLLSRRSEWPKWKRPFGYWAFILLTITFSWGLLNSYLLNGDVSQWALINKFCGWFILCAYIGLGAWLQTNSPQTLYRAFYIALLFAFILLSSLNLFHYLSFRISGIELFTSTSLNIEGFMYNRNAYALLFLFVIVQCTYPPSGVNTNPKLEKVLHVIFWALLPLLLFFNASRALWLCLILFSPFIYIHYPTLKRKLVFLLLLGSTVLIALLPANVQKVGHHPFEQTILLFADTETKEKIANKMEAHKTYNNVRFSNLDNSFSMIKEHPIRGSGLGAIIEKQYEQGAEMVTVLDNTLLWILTEMGAIGLLAFAIVYFAMIKALIGSQKWPFDNYTKSGVCVMLIFGVFSLFHEVLYTRLFWFILGMMLVIPRPEDQAIEKQPR